MQTFVASRRPTIDIPGKNQLVSIRRNTAQISPAQVIRLYNISWRRFFMVNVNTIRDWGL